jgi:hypothetical protein
MTTTLRKLSASNDALVRHVWPKVGNAWAQLLPTELCEDRAARALDQRAGIDALLILRKGGQVFGLASRVQPVLKSFDTWTVRTVRPNGEPTEYAKITAAKRSGALYPHFICHAYMSADGTTLLAAAIAQTDDVIRAVDARQGWEIVNTEDGVLAWAVPWPVIPQRIQWPSS